LHEYSNLFWTLSVEFQFYLIFPLLVIFMRRRGWILLIEIFALAVGLRLLGVASGAQAHTMSYSFINGRLDQFLMGMLAAIALRSGVLTKRRCRALVLPSTVIVLGVLYGFHRLGGFPLEAWWKVFWPTVEGTAWALVVASYVGAEIALPKALSIALCKIGERSFSIYLLHFVILVAMVKNSLAVHFGSAIESSLLSSVVMLLPATLVAASLTYRVVEEPFLNMRKRYIEEPANRSSIQEVSNV
jgi:peptidoglycan/LPS O-acetylase OafA/YrhL